MSLYRKSTPYRSSKGYRGLSTGPFTPSPTLWTFVRAPFTGEAEQSAITRLPTADVTAHNAAPRIAWAEPSPHEADTRLLFGQRTARSESPRLPFADTVDHFAVDTRAPFGQPTPHDAGTALPWAETSVRTARATGLRFGQRAPHETSTATPWGALAAHAGSLGAVWRAMAARGALIALPWGPMGSHQAGIRTPYPVDPNPGDPGADPITAPILPVYVMIPTLTAVVLPARTPLNLLTCSLSTDASQYGWRFAGNLAAVDLPLVNPAGLADPVAIEITINGYTWIVSVDAFSDQRRFGGKTVGLSGASRSSVLAAPRAPRRSRLQADARNASQLADEELGDGLSLPETGWTLVWDAVDWLVPGGTWSYADLAPIDAIARVAAAIGARVETDRTLLQLAVRPTYPVSPWAWDAETPYAILPASILTAGDGRWQGGSNADRIYCYSSNAGYGALVSISGGPTSIALPMVVDSLLTMADPARERGRHELAAASRIKLETRTIPLFPSPADPGLLPIGELIDVQDSATEEWRGQVMGVRIDASRQGTAFSVRQTLSIERHFR